MDILRTFKEDSKTFFYLTGKLSFGVPGCIQLGENYFATPLFLQDEQGNLKVHGKDKEGNERTLYKLDYSGKKTEVDTSNFNEGKTKVFTILVRMNLIKNEKPTYKRVEFAGDKRLMKNVFRYLDKNIPFFAEGEVIYSKGNETGISGEVYKISKIKLIEETEDEIEENKKRMRKNNSKNKKKDTLSSSCFS